MSKIRRRLIAEDGYILLYVMVVVMTLCILAASICTSAVRNLKVQQHSVEHMKFVYEAEGIGERFVSELQNAARFRADGTVKTYTVTSTAGDPGDRKHGEAGRELLIEAMEIAIAHALLDPALKEDTFTLLNPEGTEIQPEQLAVGNYDATGHVECPVKFRIVTEESSLDAEILVTILMNQTESPEGYQYNIQQISYQYESYVIGSVSGEGGGE